MSDFKIGDRVETIRIGNLPIGLRGTVVKIIPNYIGIEFDENTWELYNYGHNCEGSAKSGHGYYLLRGDLKLIQDNENSTTRIRWYSKGRFTKWENK